MVNPWNRPADGGVRAGDVWGDGGGGVPGGVQRRRGTELSRACIGGTGESRGRRGCLKLRLRDLLKGGGRRRPKNGAPWGLLGCLLSLSAGLWMLVEKCSEAPGCLLFVSEAFLMFATW